MKCMKSSCPSWGQKKNTSVKNLISRSNRKNSPNSNNKRSKSTKKQSRENLAKLRTSTLLATPKSRFKLFKTASKKLFRMFAERPPKSSNKLKCLQIWVRAKSVSSKKRSKKTLRKRPLLAASVKCFSTRTTLCIWSMRLCLMKRKLKEMSLLKASKLKWQPLQKHLMHKKNREQLKLNKTLLSSKRSILRSKLTRLKKRTTRRKWTSTKTKWKLPRATSRKS